MSEKEKHGRLVGKLGKVKSIVVWSIDKAEMNLMT